MSAEPLAALILAGGLSRRMGADKALLDLAGTPMLRHTWEIAQTLTPAVWVVTAWPERYQACLPASAQWILETAPLPNTPPSGPLVAFAQALPQVEADWVLLLPCDLPALRVEVLAQWQQALPQVPPGAIAYLPHQPQGWEPLCGFYRRTCLPNLQTYVATGGRSFQQWLAQQPVQAIPNVPAEMLVNCNTPADWARYRAQLPLQTPDNAG
ncbi:MAG: molybdenum cofactor guanylyltransferase [Leptolyngbya sp. SIO1E4]|nr:molybdenum cofactor guanylyltransferase [Leptolyngbya sp. SIO1E4]